MILSKFKSGKRPSYRELDKKLTEVRSLIRDQRWLPAEVSKLKANFDSLEQRFGVDTTTTEDQTTLLLKAAQEVTPDDYAGARPPQEAYEHEIKGEDLFAFRWKSVSFGNVDMYFKFCLKGTDKGRKAYICSIHEHKEK